MSATLSASLTFPRYNKENIALLQEAITKGYTHYCPSIEGYETTISDLIVDNPEDSSLYAPFNNFPKTMSAAYAIKIEKEGQKARQRRDHSRLSRVFMTSSSTTMRPIAETTLASPALKAVMSTTPT